MGHIWETAQSDDTLICKNVHTAITFQILTHNKVKKYVKEMPSALVYLAAEWWQTLEEDGSRSISS
jgi:hypothetical protein